MILSVTPNPGLDRVVLIPGLVPGQIYEHPRLLTVSAGKGVSMARAARTLGADVVCAGFLGGTYGHYHEQLSTDEGLKIAWTWIEAETRNCLILVDTVSHKATVVNEPGPTVTASDWQRLHTDLLRRSADADYVTFSGSLPPGSPFEAYANLLHDLIQAGTEVWVDTSGEALRTAMAARPAGIKVNGSEAAALVGTSADTVETAVQAAQDLRSQGIRNVALTLGEQGAVLVNGQGQWWARPPSIQVASAVGSGDSFFAGLITGLSRGLASDEALRWGVAAGAANALSLLAGKFEAAEFEAVLAKTTVQPV